MADKFKFEGDIKAAARAFGDLTWRRQGRNNFIFDNKKDEFVPVERGEWIVRTSNGFKVSKTEPKRASKATEEEPVSDLGVESASSTGQVADPTPAPEENDGE